MRAETKDELGNWVAFEIDAGKAYASASSEKRVELTRRQLEFLGRVIEHMIEDLPADYPTEPEAHLSPCSCREYVGATSTAADPHEAGDNGCVYQGALQKVPL